MTNNHDIRLNDARRNSLEKELKREKRIVTPELIGKVRDGDHEAFSVLYVHYKDSMTRFLARLVGDAEDAEEITQDAYEHIWKHRDKLDPSKSFKSFLYSIARNKAFNAMRRNSVTADIFTDYGYMFEGDHDSADRQFVEKETLLLIEITVSGMPKLRREVYRMHLEGIAPDIIAERLQISNSSVRMHISRAKSEVMETLYLVMFFLINI